MGKCCFGCVAPKRTATCHATCPDYAAEEAANRERYRVNALQRDADAAEVARIHRGKKALQRARTGRNLG